MLVFTGIVARAIPLMLGLAALLVAARLLHDRVAPASAAVARALFVAVPLAGAAASVPYAVRSAALVGAEHAFLSGSYARASARFARAFPPGRPPGGRAALHWGVALMNQKRWRDAESVLVASVPRPKKGAPLRVMFEVVQAIGICRYYEGRLGAARAALEASSSPSTRYLCDYFLGRIAERTGDAAGARERYAASWSGAPGFVPALYQLLRVDARAGRGDSVLRTLPPAPGAVAPQVEAIRSELARAGALPEREFFLVQRF